MIVNLIKKEFRPKDILYTLNVFSKGKKSEIDISEVGGNMKLIDVRDGVSEDRERLRLSRLVFRAAIEEIDRVNRYIEYTNNMGVVGEHVGIKFDQKRGY